MLLHNSSPILVSSTDPHNCGWHKGTTEPSHPEDTRYCPYKLKTAHSFSFQLSEPCLAVREHIGFEISELKDIAGNFGILMLQGHRRKAWTGA